MAKIKILGQVFTTSHGVLKSGDVLVCSDEFANHLVNDAGAAEYLAPPEDAQDETETQSESPRRGRPAKK